jgi:hypothetical protein
MRLSCQLGIIAIAIVLSYGPASATALGDLAASMQAGDWAELSTTNLEPTLSSNSGGATGSYLPYQEDAVWDPNSEQFLFIGSDHQHQSGYAQFGAYSAQTNAWRSMPRPSWFHSITASAMHGYDHNAINADKGYHYFMQYCCSPKLRRYDIAAGTWAELAGIGAYYQAAGGLEHFPEKGGLIFAADYGGGNVWFYNEATNRWTTLASNLAMGGHHNFAEYNPVHKVMILGGGDGSGAIYKLDTNFNITRMTDAPFSLRVQQAIVTVDPVTGDYLVFGGAGLFYTYDVINDKWTRQSGTNPLAQPPLYQSDKPYLVTIASPISSYGVTMFVKHNPMGNQAWVYLYKHSSTTGTAGAAVPDQDVAVNVWPNPFNSTVKIMVRRYAYGVRRVSSQIYNISGKLVKDFTPYASRITPYAFNWNASQTPPGIYLLKVKLGTRHITKKLFIAR